MARGGGELKGQLECSTWSEVGAEFGSRRDDGLVGDMQRDSRDAAVSEPRSFPNPPDILAKVGGYREKPVTSKKRCERSELLSSVVEKRTVAFIFVRI